MHIGAVDSGSQARGGEAVAAVQAVDEPPGAPPPFEVTRERNGRRFARLRHHLPGHPGRTSEDAGDDAEDIRLELILLREQIMRLQSDRRRPFDLGTLIDQLRIRTSATDDIDSNDDAWALLGEYHMLRENLDLARTELDVAIVRIRSRLAVGPAEPAPNSATSVEAGDAPVRTSIASVA